MGWQVARLTRRDHAACISSKHKATQDESEMSATWVEGDLSEAGWILGPSGHPSKCIRDDRVYGLEPWRDQSYPQRWSPSQGTKWGELYGIIILWGARERGSPSTGCRVERWPGLTDTWFRKGERGQVLPRGGEGLTLVPRWLTIQRLLVTVAGASIG